MITLTEERIEQLKTKAGGWNRKTLNLIGVPWPPQKGWKDEAIGRQVSDRNYAAALDASEEARHFFRGNTRSSR